MMSFLLSLITMAGLGGGSCRAACSDCSDCCDDCASCCNACDDCC
jgi:hypothetical protein